MEKNEFENWTEARKQGAKIYVIKTTLIAFFICFFTYVVGNGYVNRDNLDKYIESNLANLDYVLLTCVISIFFMTIATSIVWKFSESRYKKTIEANNKIQSEE